MTIDENIVKDIRFLLKQIMVFNVVSAVLLFLAVL